MQLTIPNIKLKGIKKRYSKINCRAPLADLYRILSHLKKIDDNTNRKNGWYYVYRKHLEKFSVDYLEILIILCNWKIIEIIDEGFYYKLRVRIVDKYRLTNRKVNI